MRRLRDLWRRLQVRDDDQDTLVLLNQASRKREVQPDLARKVVGGRLAADDDPGRLRRLRGRRQHGLARAPGGPEAARRVRGARDRARGAARGRASRPSTDGEPRGLLARLSGERGQASVEFAGILPLLLVVIILLWQIGLVGYTFMLAGHAAREGARELAIDTTDTKKDRPYADKAVEDLPKAWKQGREGRPRRTTRPSRVKLKVPVLFPGVHTPWKVDLRGRHRRSRTSRCRASQKGGL